jgi:ribosomal 30S subunit maturation factor RimM
VEIFDTDTAHPKLSAHFLGRSTVLDLDKVRDQMSLFDRLAAPSAEVQIVDVAAHSFKKFFDLMRESDYVAEARARNVETVIFYIPERDAESYEEGGRLLARFPDCAFVTAENENLGEIDKYARVGDGYLALKQHARRMLIPRLDSLFALALAESKLSLGDFLHEPPPERTPAHNSIAYASPHMRAGIGRFAKSLFEQIERAMQGVGAAAAVPAESAEAAPGDAPPS